MTRHNIRILVVDDFSTMRRIIRGILRELGFNNIIEADDGVTAWPLIEKGDFDLIVTDWNMPKMSGYELLCKIRASEQFSALPVLMVTAETKREQIITAAKAGVNGYIIKPFTTESLKEKIDKIFERIDRAA